MSATQQAALDALAPLVAQREPVNEREKKMDMNTRNRVMTDALEKVNATARAAIGSPWRPRFDGVTPLFWADLARDAAALAVLAAQEANEQMQSGIRDYGNAEVNGRLDSYLEEQP